MKDLQTDGRQAVRKAHLSLQLSWANKRPMGQISHPRKSSTHLHSYDYTITLSTYWELNIPYFEKLPLKNKTWKTSTSPKDAFCQVCWFWRRFFKFIYFRYFIFIFPRKGIRPSFKWTWILFTQGCFGPNGVEAGLVILEKKIFKCL